MNKNNLKKTIITFLTLCVVGLTDWLSGYELFFSIFYLIPLSWLAYQKNTTLPVLILNFCFAAIIWLLTEVFLITQHYSFNIMLWNGFVRLASFASVPFLIYFLRKRQKTLSDINQHISEFKSEIEAQNNYLQAKNEELLVIKEELEMLAAVAGKTDVAVTIMDKETNIEWVNDGFEKKYHLNPGDLKIQFGNKYAAFIAEESLQTNINQCILTKEPVIFESERNLPGNVKVYFQTTLTPILDAGGNIAKLIAIDSDISKLKAVEKNLMEQNALINNKNQKIRDSLFYAQSIQQIILPPKNKLEAYFKDLLVFFKPKDIVSGDFYWFYEYGHLAFIAVADCTGHGVPGAMMSMIGNTLLNEIVILKKVFSPAGILDELNVRIIQTFSQNQETNSSNYDGMDISLCCIDKKNNTMTISNAGHSVIIIKNDVMKTIESDLFSIGSFYLKQKSTSYAETVFTMDASISVYMFSDGFQDQFGGTNDTKYMQKRFSDLIYSMYQKSFEQQFNTLHTEFSAWKGDGQQTDDVLVIGFKLT